MPEITHLTSAMYLSASTQVPAAWIAHITNVVARFNVSADRLLEGQPITPRELADPRARVSVEVLTAIIERSRCLTREPAIGIYLGLQTRATLWGHLGFATLSAPSMRAALELAVRFCDVVTPAIGFRLGEYRGTAELILDEHADFGSARDAVVFWLLVGIWNVGRMMTGAKTEVQLELAMAEPMYMSRLRLSLPSMRFRQRAHRLLIPASRLDLPYVLHDPSALRAATELCEQQHQGAALENPHTRRVRDLLTRETMLPSFKVVATQLHLSERTLSRRLASEDSSFRAMLEAERQRRGVGLVMANQDSLNQIASGLGYSTVSNFERAFRRWTGLTPTQYRREMQRSGTIHDMHADHVPVMQTSRARHE